MCVWRWRRICDGPIFCHLCSLFLHETLKTTLSKSQKRSRHGRSQSPHSRWRESPNFVHAGRVTILWNSHGQRGREQKPELAGHARIELHSRIHAACALPCKICGTSRTLTDDRERTERFRRPLSLLRTDYVEDYDEKKNLHHLPWTPAPTPSAGVQICERLEDVRNTFTTGSCSERVLEKSCRCPGDQSSENVVGHNPSDTSISLLQSCDPAQSENLQCCGWDMAPGKDVCWHSNPESLSDSNNGCKCSQVMPDGPGAAPRLALLKLRQNCRHRDRTDGLGHRHLLGRRRLRWGCRSACWFLKAFNVFLSPGGQPCRLQNLSCRKHFTGGRRNQPPIPPQALLELRRFKTNYLCQTLLQQNLALARTILDFRSQSVVMIVDLGQNFRCALSVQHCHVHDGRSANILRIVNQHQTSHNP